MFTPQSVAVSHDVEINTHEKVTKTSQTNTMSPLQPPTSPHNDIMYTYNTVPAQRHNFQLDDCQCYHLVTFHYFQDFRTKTLIKEAIMENDFLKNLSPGQVAVCRLF